MLRRIQYLVPAEQITTPSQPVLTIWSTAPAPGGANLAVVDAQLRALQSKLCLAPHTSIQASRMGKPQSSKKELNPKPRTHPPIPQQHVSFVKLSVCLQKILITEPFSTTYKPLLQFRKWRLSHALLCLLTDEYSSSETGSPPTPTWTQLPRLPWQPSKMVPRQDNL